MVTRVHSKKASLVHAAQLATSIATQCSEIQTFIFGMLKVWEIIRRILSLQRLNKATSDRPFKTYTRLTVHKEKSPPLCREIL